jgi:hypothetical protein
MDKIKEFESIIIKIIERYSNVKTTETTQFQAIFDKEKNHYLLYAVGWEGKKRTHGCIMHIDIIRDKIWIQHNGTDVRIGEEMVRQGVDRKDIILAFHSPTIWEFTDFGTDEEYRDKVIKTMNEK